MLFRVLGPLRVNHADGRAAGIETGEQRRMLCALLLRPNGWAGAESLAEAVWPEQTLADPRGQVWSCVHELRRLTPFFGTTSARIDSRGGRHRLNIAEGELDSAVFEELIGTGLAALADEAPDDEARDDDAPADEVPGRDVELAAHCFREALDLWRGTPFDELRTYHSRAEAARLTQLRWIALDGLVAALLAAGATADAVTLLHALTTEDPAREATWRKLVDVLYQVGRPAEAEAASRKAARVTGLRHSPGRSPAPVPQVYAI